MRMLVLSDSLPTDSGYPHIEVYRWTASNRPLISNYHILVLDMKMYRDTRATPEAFTRITEEIVKLLKSGGVVICLTYTITEIEGKISRYRIVYDHPARRERTTDTKVTSYDWLPTGILEATELYRKSDPGTDYELIKKSEELKPYFDCVEGFQKIIEGGVYSESRKKWIFRYPEFSNGGFRIRTCDMDVIAINPVTKDPIACVIYYQGGSLIFLPQSEHDPLNVVYYLFQIGKRYYELNIEERGLFLDAPEWIENYKTEHEKSIEVEISQLEDSLQKEKSKRSRFQKIDALLYATNKTLEKAVMLVFQDFGLNVEKADPGANKDLVVEDNSGNRLLVEVTGVKGKINSNSRKMAQLWDLVLEKRSEEKIVLIANTYREKEPAERSGEENFTEKVINLCEKNDICLMTTVDLFNLWKNVREGKKTPEQVIDSVLETNGIYIIQYPRSDS